MNIENNSVENNGDAGMDITGARNSVLTNNNISTNAYGIRLYSSSNNLIYHNNFKNNINYNAYDNSGTNSWDNGYPDGGNYWSDYTGADNYRGTNQDQVGSDGIGDTPYNISGGAGAQDRYPFMNENGWITPENLPPVADCGADKLSCENVGAPVQFDASASFDPDGTIVSYQWDFGDGTTGSGVSPKHTYATYNWNGTAYQPFTVTLTVTDDRGATDTDTQLVTVWIAGDANGDGRVNILDAATLGLNWSGADACADLNNDGVVNILDAALIGLNWGKVA
jgi:parallel beta-helix repeat protein